MRSAREAEGKKIRSQYRIIATLLGLCVTGYDSTGRIMLNEKPLHCVRLWWLQLDHCQRICKRQAYSTIM
jgi:hypothetical protein